MGEDSAKAVLNQIVTSSPPAAPPQGNNPIQGILEGVGSVLNNAGVEVRIGWQVIYQFTCHLESHDILYSERILPS